MLHSIQGVQVSNPVCQSIRIGNNQSPIVFPSPATTKIPIFKNARHNFEHLKPLPLPPNKKTSFK